MSVSLNMQLDGIKELQKELDYIKSHAVKVGVLGKNGAGEMKNEIAQKKNLRENKKIKKEMIKNVLHIKSWIQD